VHAELQQNPSAQNPEAHSAAPPQEAPCGLSVVVVVVGATVIVVVVVLDWQTPPLHVKGAIQSALPAQLVLQPPTVQTYGEHDDIVPELQVPLPSQVLGLVNVSPLHDAAAQGVPAPYC